MPSHNGNGRNRQPHDKRNPPKRVSPRQQLQAYNPGQWFMMPRPFIWLFGIDDALLLAYLIDTACRYSNLNYRSGWFYCTVEKMEWELRIKEDKQQRILKRLRELGVISTRQMGPLRRRWFRINVPKLQSLVGDRLEKREQESRVRRREQIRKRKERDDGLD